MDYTVTVNTNSTRKTLNTIKKERLKYRNFSFMEKVGYAKE
jgi:hypothetical protein